MSFSYGDEQISFERVLRHQGSSKALIKVYPDCRVVVSAHEDACNDDVLTAVKKRGRWIYEQLRDFRKQLEHITPRQYISGESHYYLGKQYQLKVIEDLSQAPGVKLLRGKLEVTIKQKSPEAVQKVLVDWYRVRAKEVFAKRLDAMLEQALWVNERPPMRIFSMKTQWGSCSPNGRLTLNPHLVKASRECIDYVILHELCHIAEHNHSERFYRMLAGVLPNYMKVKDILDAKVSEFVS
ncbi:M48 family metallopeptidase [Zhongshania aquimaris]|uniref:M48 family metallopeptidase n=1 Tax=Zhongshania aquimaris TaxID=2857107 RepID=A0ABS6VS02_9GAMM|nr:SprT family zinc-dependent metalloprotease [Zhongshania aquimaris]MBW2940540.1 M48 family metallopeptidase [Zhongshania aquimaris]